MRAGSSNPGAIPIGSVFEDSILDPRPPSQGLRRDKDYSDYADFTEGGTGEGSRWGSSRGEGREQGEVTIGQRICVT